MEYICIVCPNGCRLTVEQTREGVVVRGNSCPKGDGYGRDESTDPRRVVTAVVRTTSRDHPCVPVKTDRAVPKALITQLLQAIYTLRVTLPVRRGDVCVADCCGTGASIIFTRSFSDQPPEGTA